jgi:light-regulated signal transduction histidine kinase (bacteriophytochrome)
LPAVSGERTLLTLVFQNLVGNAIKFARPGQPPKIHVAHRRDGAFHHLAIHDDGIGIEAEYADRIFVIFQRLHAKDEYPGTGIGLAMARKIVEHHGGEIGLDVEHDGPGTTIAFTLPALPEEPNQ